MDETLIITNQASELGRVLAWLEHQGRHMQLQERTLFQLDVLLNEVLPNIINYAYEDQQSHIIKLRLETKGNNVVLEIIDDGIAFDPFAQAPFEPSQNLGSAAIGGRGIHLLKAFSDGQEYQRADGFNIVRFSIFITAKANPTAAAVSA